MEKYEIEEDGDFKIPADLKYKFICEHIIGKNLDYDNLTCAILITLLKVLNQ